MGSAVLVVLIFQAFQQGLISWPDVSFNEGAEGGEGGEEPKSYDDLTDAQKIQESERQIEAMERQLKENPDHPYRTEIEEAIAAEKADIELIKQGGPRGGTVH